MDLRKSHFSPFKSDGFVGLAVQCSDLAEDQYHLEREFSPQLEFFSRRYAFEWPDGWIGIDADVWPEKENF